ncbi:HalD/BesD family halogenase [Aquibaculum sediminis]|uniref:HalD/BesD family halogenase n=1 Tax=Aquibaculum sediminis TaxID=3231907 RepID=UPI0034533CD1
MLAEDRQLAPAEVDLGGLIDLERYPLDRLDSPEGRALLASCRASLAGDGCAVLPGFVHPEALRAMGEETRRLAPGAHINDTQTNPYSSDGDSDLPADHPRNLFMDRSNGFVGGDLIGQETAIRQLYHHPAFQRFVQRAMGVEELHEYADPLGGLVINVLKPGCQHPWHYDTNEFVVSMMTREPEEGGLFQYAPNIRSTESENYEAVGRVLHGDEGPVKTLQLKPGDLQIFFGRYSLHRVSRVGGEKDRHTVIFGFAREPGMIARAARTKRIFGRLHPIHEAETADGPARSDSLAD